MKRNLPICWTMFAALCAAQALAAPLQVAFWSDGQLMIVDREACAGPATAQAAIEAMLAGPTGQEQQQGISSAFLPGTKLVHMTVGETTATVDLSPEALTGFDEARLEAMYTQTHWTLQLAGLTQSAKLTAADVLLSEFLTPAPSAPPRPKAAASSEPVAMIASAGSALAGKTISLSPGHGKRFTGSGWSYERPQTCPPLNREDLHNVELVVYLNNFLLQDGATTKVYRCLDKSFGTCPYTNEPWWRASAPYWLELVGYPCSVYANYSGDCALGTGDDETNDQIRSRPTAADYDNTDIHLSIHTNALSGNCYGPTCPNGTITFYDASAEHAEWGDASKDLAKKINNNMCTVITNQYGDADWYNRGASNANGGFAEARIPDRPAVLIETAFHDSCDRDALYLQDEFFRSTAMYGVYKGVCLYFGTSPIAFHAAAYVSDTIPSRMLPGRTYQVSLTLTNRSVLWVPERGYRLGAVDDSDPFTSLTRIDLSNSVDTGIDHTFTFTMTAPEAAGSYTSDWRMFRDPGTWFGATHTEQIEVRWPDFDEDEDIDMADFGHFQACMTAPDVPQLDSECENTRLDTDEDVDADDFGLFQACANGAAMPIDVTCARN